MVLHIIMTSFQPYPRRSSCFLSSLNHLRGSAEFAGVLLEHCSKASPIICLKLAMQRYRNADTSDQPNTSFTGHSAAAYLYSIYTYLHFTLSIIPHSHPSPLSILVPIAL